MSERIDTLRLFRQNARWRIEKVILTVAAARWEGG
jgi:hypothetical protein